MAAKSIATSIPVHNSYKWWALSATSLGMFMVVINATTLLIALPNLIRVLHMSALLAIWVMLAYMVTQTALLLTAGRLSDLFGRKPFYVAGFAIFTLAALGAGFVPNGTDLLILRAIQAIGGAMVMGNATAIVTDAFPRAQLGFALGINSIVIAIGQVTGPIIGGLLVIRYSWHWIFWFNVPIGLVGTLWALFLLKEPLRHPSSATMDFAGNVTYLVALVSLLVALTWGGIRGWLSPVVPIGFFLAIVGTAAFIRLEKSTQSPLLNLHLFDDRTFTMANLSNFLIAVGRGAIVLLFIFYFQGALGENALQAGLAVFPLAAAMGISAPISGWLSDRVGARGLATAGAVLVGLGLLGEAVTLHLHTSYAMIAFWLVVTGIGNGLFNSPNTSAIMSAVARQERGVAAGTRTMLVNTGNVFSLAFVLAVVATAVPAPIMLKIFAGETAAVAPNLLGTFVTGINIAFFLMAAISFLAAYISAIRGNSTQSTATIPLHAR